MKKTFSYAEIDFITKSKKHLTISEIAEKLNRDYHSIYAFLRNKKLPFKRQNFSNNPDLTKAEEEVIKLMSKGLSNAQIADKLFVSTTTVKTHIYNIFRKYDLNENSRACSVMRVRAVLKYLNLESEYDKI